jgi:hypothetical protein
MHLLISIVRITEWILRRLAREGGGWIGFEWLRIGIYGVLL